ncbi:MAG: UspA domain-containing protein, partial [Elusimicrobia bacterium]
MNTRTQQIEAKKIAPFPPASILVPVDFSGCSLAGLAAARTLAKRWNSSVTLAHVDEAPEDSFCEGMRPSPEREALERYHRDIRHRLAETAAKAPGASTRMLEGNPREAVPLLVAGGAADMIVMGTHGRRGLRRFCLGSVAEAAVHVSSVPVLTVRFRPNPGWPSKVLVPMRPGAPYADRALLLAREWALSLKLALGVIHVSESDAPEGERDRSLERRVAALLGARGPSPEWSWRKGRPFEEILLGADAGRFDLIVLAAHVRRRWQDTLLGTTA